MAEDRTIACYRDGEHFALMMLGFLGFIAVPLPLATVAAWMTLRPRLLFNHYWSGLCRAAPQPSYKIVYS